MITPPLPAEDLQFILDRSESLFRELKGQRFFITGGTGLIGQWLLSSLLEANKRWKLGIQATVLSRNPAAFLGDHPHFNTATELKWLKGDVGQFTFPEGSFDSVVHAAADVTSGEGQIEGTKRIIEFAKKSGCRRVLFTSSGAAGEKNLTSYGQAKRSSEELFSKMFRDSGIENKVSRTFAVVGPGLPLDGHYAIGNFICDGLKGGPIHVAGDGTPTRSYLYMAEHTLWLWTVLVKGMPDRPYNVGSPEGCSIREVAEICGKYFKVPVQIATQLKPGAEISRYVPDISLTQKELGLQVEIPLSDAIDRTVRYLRSRA